MRTDLNHRPLNFSGSIEFVEIRVQSHRRKTRDRVAQHQGRCSSEDHRRDQPEHASRPHVQILEYCDRKSVKFTSTVVSAFLSSLSLRHPCCRPKPRGPALEDVLTILRSENHKIPKRDHDQIVSNATNAMFRPNLADQPCRSQKPNWASLPDRSATTRSAHQHVATAHSASAFSRWRWCVATWTCTGATLSRGAEPARSGHADVGGRDPTLV